MSASTTFGPVPVRTEAGRTGGAQGRARDGGRNGGARHRERLGPVASGRTPAALGGIAARR
ncbi:MULTISPECIES: hypothetical protein [unclassified Streptomyces]|uniref:hypothetical protein n=1 Tax=unclassified Streptomyces TaxID=2593676 RepID=UPI000F6EF757|nr:MULTISPECIES: hypothetical protein [unclassified Streptomyces]AZM59142.1 hypothetical protein DLM49_05835 [Streptomyces sp. WAC 01438]RSM96748.1 hypothetical protein DMA10_12930 [Streptomyces sp. WAC 01420]